MKIEEKLLSSITNARIAIWNLSSDLEAYENVLIYRIESQQRKLDPSFDPVLAGLMGFER